MRSCKIIFKGAQMTVYSKPHFNGEDLFANCKTILSVLQLKDACLDVISTQS